MNETRFFNHALKTLDYHIYHSDDNVTLMINKGSSCLRKKIDFVDPLTKLICQRLGLEIDDCILEYFLSSKELIQGSSNNQIINQILDDKKTLVISNVWKGNLVQILTQLNKVNWNQNTKSQNPIFPLLTERQLKLLTVKYK